MLVTVQPGFLSVHRPGPSEVERETIPGDEGWTSRNLLLGIDGSEGVRVEREHGLFLSCPRTC